jgi:hypothetical protein
METVKIKAEKTRGNESGYVVINKEDFDAEKHTLFDAPVAPKKEKEKVQLNASTMSNDALKKALQDAEVEFSDDADRSVLISLVNEKINGKK